MKIFISVVVLIILGAGAYTVFQSFRPTEYVNEFQTKLVSNNQQSRSEKAIKESSVSATQLAEPYIEYSEETFSQSPGDKTRILFFYADWCPTCRPVDAEIRSHLDEIPEDIQVIKVNYNDEFTDDEEKKLAAKYGITYQHTFVRVDTAGNEIEKWNGGNFDDLISRIKSVSGEFNLKSRLIPITDGPITPQ